MTPATSTPDLAAQVHSLGSWLIESREADQLPQAEWDRLLREFRELRARWEREQELAVLALAGREFVMSADGVEDEGVHRTPVIEGTLAQELMPVSGQAQGHGLSIVGGLGLLGHHGGSHGFSRYTPNATTP